MPTCAQCGSTYIDGEAHRCEGNPANPLAQLAMIVVGFVVGAGVVSAALMVAMDTLTAGADESGVLSILIGTPRGGISGAILGARSVKSNIRRRL